MEVLILRFGGTAKSKEPGYSQRLEKGRKLIKK